MIELHQISKKYNGSNILNNISFSAKRGEIVGIYGPNGSGKTTLLNIINGLITPTSGKVKSNVDSIGYVPQNYNDSLFPWYNVQDNISLPLDVKNESKSDNSEKILQLLHFLDFKIPLNSFPNELSGGQQQMVSICRSLIDSPDLLILDEPFSALDRKKKQDNLNRLRAYSLENQCCTFFVSHSLDEVMLFCSRVILFSESPTKIIGDLKLSFEENRDFKLLETDKFNNKRSEIMNLINSVI